MKAKLVLAMLLIFVTPFLIYSSERFAYSITPSVGVATGNVYEYVYDGSHLLSRLDWQQYAIPIAVIDSRISLGRFFLDGSILAALPLSKCGIMEDRDWRDYTSPAITDYSKHDLRLDWRFDFSEEFGYRFGFTNLAIDLSLGAVYRTQQWTGMNGYNIVGSTFFGDVISYTQSILLTSAAMKFDYVINGSWQVCLGGKIHPYILTDATDKHYLRKEINHPDGLVFYDVMRGGFGFTVNASIRYKKIVLSGEYENYFIKHGTTKYGNLGSTYTGLKKDGSTPGTSDSLFKITLGYKFD